MSKVPHSKPNIIVTAMIFQKVPPPNQSGIVPKSVVNVAKKLLASREAQSNAKPIINKIRNNKTRVFKL